MVFKKGMKTWNDGIHMKEEIKEKIRNKTKGNHNYINTINCEKCNKEIVVYTTQQWLCKDCRRLQDNENKINRLKNEDNHIKHLKRCRNWVLKNQDKHREYNRKWCEENPLIIIDHTLSKDIPLKPSCEICGSIKHLEKHHWRYDKPLLVNTLCSTCHRIQHIKNFNKSIYALEVIEYVS